MMEMDVAQLLEHARQMIALAQDDADGEPDRRPATYATADAIQALEQLECRLTALEKVVWRLEGK